MRNAVMLNAQARSLFNRPRLKLAAAYAGAMGVLLTVLGIALHQAIATSSDEIIERELKTLGILFQAGLKPLLLQPGQLNPQATSSFLCIAGEDCQGLWVSTETTALPGPSLSMAALTQEGYSLRLLNLQGQTVTTLGPEASTLAVLPLEPSWQYSRDRQGNRYRVYSLPLTTNQPQGQPQGQPPDQTAPPSPEPWGYLQIGCSYQALEQYMHLLHLLLFLGLPLGIASIGLVAWWLSGMAMRPVVVAYQQIEQFTADVAHELRTPLAAMQATAEAELSQLAPQSSNTQRPGSSAANLAIAEQSAIPILHRQILRLSKLVQDLLLLSRLAQHSQPLITQRVALDELLEDLEEEFAPLVLESRIHFQLSLPPERLTTPGDPDALYRLFMNLIANGIQHTPPAGTVAVAMVAADRMVKITVQDSGPGIEPAKQQQIFDRFYRIAGERDRQTGGAGLGLAIAQAIAQRHGGSIQLTSELGQGSCFSVRLPLG